MQSTLVTSFFPPATVFLPLLGTGAAIGLGRVSERAREIGLAVICAIVVVLTFAVIPGVLGGTVYEAHLVRLTPTIWIYLRIDAMGALYAATVSLLWLLAVVYSAGYMRGGHRLTRYYSFLMMCLGWTLGVAYAGNLLTFLLFYELFSILTYPLVVHEETPQAMAAGTKYIIYILIGGSLVLLGVVLTYFISGEQTLTAGGILNAAMDHTALLAIFWCFIAGFGVKAALVPLHGWVPDAHPAAPAPFSAVLSGVMVAAGSFGIMRVVYQVFGVELLQEMGVMPYVAGIAAFTIIFAAVLAVGQDDLKRRLAYSTISQMGYVALGIGLLGSEATIGALVHIANHAFMKGTLFLCAGLLIKRTGLRNVSEMAGVAKRMPVTMAAFALAALGMIGTPPLSGFISKWYLGLGILEVHSPLYLAVLLGGALLAAIYLLPIVYVAYFKQPPALAGETELEAEAPASMLVPTIIAASLTIVLGLAATAPGLPYSLAYLSAQTFFP
ncbi:MAG: proton-conducting transporter membrane subunit [Coriobacteriia bacterium]|nr:proton-conducting transporter membrane subunit [Coriobacteriia bacterium]